MKKFLKLFTFMAMALSLMLTLPAVHSQAQSTLISPVYGNSLDTVTNTGVKVLWLQLQGYRETVTATINITKISGTLGGTLIPIASNDGVNFYQTAAITTADTAYTVTNVAAQGKNYNFPRGYAYYGVQWTGTGTMSGSFNGKLIGRKTNQ
jgi:hypothetical protein